MNRDIISNFCLPGKIRIKVISAINFSRTNRRNDITFENSGFICR